MGMYIGHEIMDSGWDGFVFVFGLRIQSWCSLHMYPYLGWRSGFPGILVWLVSFILHRCVACIWWIFLLLLLFCVGNTHFGGEFGGYL